MSINNIPNDIDIWQENQELRLRLDEAEETLRAIRQGEVDALIVNGSQGEQVFTLVGADHAYRMLIEEMNEGALTLDIDGIVLYCNRSFARMMKTPHQQLIGSSVFDMLYQDDLYNLQVDITSNEGMAQREINFMRGDGSSLPVYCSINSILVEGITRLSVVITDLSEIKERANELKLANSQLRQEITERKRMEEELREKELYLSLNLAGMTKLQELSTRLVHADDFNALLKEILAVSAELTSTDRGNIQFFEPGTESLIIAVHQGHSPAFLNYFVQDACVGICSAAYYQKKRVIVEDVIQHPGLKGTSDLEVLLQDGIRAVQSTPLISRGGYVVGMLNNHFPIPYRPTEYELRFLDILARMAADFIEHKRAEDARRQSEELFNTAFFSSPAMMCIQRLEDGCAIDVNDNWMRVLEFSRDEIIGINLRELKLYIDPDQRLEVFQRLSQSGRIDNYETKTRTKTGIILTLLTSAEIIQVHGKRHVLWHHIDISERKMLEKNLVDALELNQAIMEASPFGIYCFDSSGQLLFVNEAGANATGGTKEMVLQQKFNFNQSDSWKRKGLQNVARQVLKTGIPGNIEAQFISILGKDMWVDERFSRFISGGEPHLLLMADDISERKQAEEAMRQSEEKFSKAFHGMPIMMTLATMEKGRFIDANEALCYQSGYAREEIIGQTSVELNLFPYRMRPELSTRIREEGRLDNYELDLRTKSGEMRNCLCWTQILYIDGELCHITGMIDITEQKQVEKEMARLDRLNLIGEMAASIGHEIRNPMTAVRGFIQLLNEQEYYAKDRVFFELMIEELDRANEIISEYLGMAKDRNINLQPQYLDQIVKDIYPMIEADAHLKGMNIELDLGKPPMPTIDKNEIRQMILNMARNGMEAMSEGSTLTIGTAEELGEIVLFIKDEGQGLPTELLDKLGTPFLTTKANGTGLGLAVCYSIAARHNARIDYKTGSEGTTFYVYFPLSEEQILLF